LSDTALLAALLAGIAGVLAGRAWAAARRRGGSSDRPEFRSSPHYSQGLHYLTQGHTALAVSELSKVVREDPDAVEVSQVLGDLLREVGQVERAIAVHQGLLARNDITRAERAHAFASLGTDYRKAGFIDRAKRTFESALEIDAGNIHALIGIEKLSEDGGQWQEAFRVQTRLARLRKTDDTRVLAHLQAELGQQAMRAGELDAAERAFRAALALDRQVFPAHLGLADLYAVRDPAKAAEVLERAVELVPERAYLAFERLDRLFTACGDPARFTQLVERIIRQDPRDWRARLALARRLSSEGRGDEALGLLRRAAEVAPHVLLIHLEVWRALRSRGLDPAAVDSYIRSAEESVFYRDPHICTACRYRADDMLWRCPHCHQWGTYVEERVAPTASSG